MQRGARRVLAAVQTPAELEWARARAAEAVEGREWSVLLLGDADESAGHRPAGGRFASVDDLEVDGEAVWSGARALLDPLWGREAAPPDRLLHLVTQRYVSRVLIRLAWQLAVAERALDWARAEEVRLPPRGASRPAPEAPQAIPELQSVLRAAAEERGVPCAVPWTARAAEALGAWTAPARQSLHLLYLAAYDAARVLSWRLRLASAPRSTPRPARPADILLANAEWELRRHFNMEGLGASLAGRCLVWSFSPPVLTPYADPSWRERAASNRLRRRGEGMADFLGVRLPAGYRDARPSPAAPLIRANSRTWYNSAWPAPREALGGSPVLRLYGGRQGAAARLMNWRRLAYAARRFAQGVDVFRAVEPALVVVSDGDIGHRALALAARGSGVRSLMTPQGVGMWTETLEQAYPLADVVCLFGRSHAFLSGRDYPGLESRRIVCHDHRLAPAAGRARPPGRGRVLIVTSRYFADWTEGMLVRRREYVEHLKALLRGLEALDPRPTVSFQPHPTQERHDFYQRLRGEHPGLVAEVRPDPLLAGDEPPPADVVVMYDCVSTVLYYAAGHGLPVLSHWGALTPLGRRLYATSGLAGSAEGLELAGMVGEVLARPDGELARLAARRLREVAERFVEPSSGGIDSALAAGLGG